MKHWLRVSAIFTVLFGTSSVYAADAPLRIGVSDSDAPPIVILGKGPNKGMISGLSRDLGDGLAHALGRRAEYTVLSRNRVENSIETGKVDIVCNANPKWYGNADRLGWTREFYPQIERLISLKGEADINSVDQLEGKRIGTILGYHYASLDPMWEAKRAIRVNDTRIDLLMRALQVKITDVAIDSELEFAAWAKANPHEARALKMHPMVFTSMPTMCAVSPKTTVSVKELDRGIEKMDKSGQIKEILKRYQWREN
jgi:ABC-type amino acid transport substrate-binding protein